MGKPVFRELRPGDIAYVADNMRAADRAEVTAMTGETDMRAALADGVLLSSHYWVLADGEIPMAIFGVAPLSLLGEMGSPWLLGTDRLERFPGTLVRDGRRYVRRMLGVYPHLVNFVDARNERSVRWLERLGFDVQAPRPMGAAGLPFHRFEMRA